MKKLFDWLIPIIVIVSLLAIIVVVCCALSSQYTKYVKEWENAPPQQTLPIETIYFPDEGITACAANFCYNSRTIIIGDSNQLHLIRRDRMNWAEWFFCRLGSQNELYLIKIELGIAGVGLEGYFSDILGRTV